ncbi:hypothetical protein [Nocardioides stalactiti]|uniref:hypothetical protein n=1 Tax=Nocardioides stalactiti TaxID=2755356 RepID=UPI0016004B28|nr:hypothetical protein [Nocardioides stalactiti]
MKTITRLVAILALVLLPLLHTPSAGAAQIQTSSYRPGPVWVNTPMITGYDHQVRLANGYYMTTKSFELGGFVAGRSPAYAGAQDIYGFYVIQRYVGGRWEAWTWQEHSGRSFSGNMSFPRWVFNPANQPNNRYAYRAVYVVSWYVAGTNRELGTVTIVPNRTADNQCVIRFGTRCGSYTDSIVF